MREAIPAQRQHRFIAAISVLFRIVQHSFEKHSGTVLRIKAEHATMFCHSCGTLDEWNPAATLTHTCSKCGLTWGQDYNAAKNVLRQGLAVWSRK
jgi:transposase